MGCNVAISKFSFHNNSTFTNSTTLSSFIMKYENFLFNNIYCVAILRNIKSDSFHWARIVQTLMGELQFGRWTKPWGKVFKFICFFHFHNHEIAFQKKKNFILNECRKKIFFCARELCSRVCWGPKKM